MEQRVIYRDIEIIATDEFGVGDFKVFFSNAQGSFELEPSDNVLPLEGFKSLKEAIQAGKKFVHQHRWQLVETTGISMIYVRKWWDDKWGYSIKPAGTNYSGFETREEAIEAARKLVIEKIADIKEKIVEMDAGRGMRLIFG